MDVGSSLCIIISFCTACFKSSGDSSIFQRIFCLVHCTDEDQKSETIVCSLKCENYDKLTWNY